MEWKYSYRFLLLCHSPKTDSFNSSFPACPPLHPYVFLPTQSYPVLSILSYFLSLCISLTFSVSFLFPTSLQTESLPPDFSSHCLFQLF